MWNYCKKGDNVTINEHPLGVNLGEFLFATQIVTTV